MVSDFALHDKDVGDVARKLSMIWNMYDFFTMCMRKLMAGSLMVS